MESKQTRYKRQKVNDEIKSHRQKNPPCFLKKNNCDKKLSKDFFIFCD